MTMQNTGLSAQIDGFHRAKTPRDLEYDAFSRVTRSLIKARRGEASVIQAASDTTELWTTLFADLADNDNALPDQLRASLISLAIFAIRQGRLLMSGEGKPDALIDVNMAIMKGLRGEVAA